VSRFTCLLLTVALFSGACNHPEPSPSVAPPEKHGPAQVAKWTPRPFPTDQVNLLAMGDWGSGGQEQRDVAQSISKYVSRTGLQFNGLLTCGDNFYVPLKDADDYHFQTLFEDMFDAKVINFPFYVSLGNHDYEKEKAKFELAYAANHPDSRWKLPSRWYRLDLPVEKPLVTILMLDSDKPRMTSDDWKAEMKWMDDELSKPRTTRWTIAAAHHPLFSNGAHGDNGVLQVQWGPIFKRHKLDFYICGHDHDIQHLELPNYKESFLLVGGGGASVRPMRLDQRGPFTKSTHGFADLNFTAEKATVRLIGPDAKPLHEFTRTREGVVEMKKTVPSDPAVPRTIKSITRGGEEPATPREATTRSATTRHVED
jgi:hypothetical protein